MSDPYYGSGGGGYDGGYAGGPPPQQHGGYGAPPQGAPGYGAGGYGGGGYGGPPQEPYGHGGGYQGQQNAPQHQPPNYYSGPPPSGSNQALAPQPGYENNYSDYSGSAVQQHGGYAHPPQQQPPYGQDYRGGEYGALPTGAPGPDGKEGERGLGATLVGSAAGGFLGHEVGGGALGTLGGIIAGAVGANALEHRHDKYESLSFSPI
ncbi:MAG: hypothetical protein M1819_004699 [Sarea resinae]|nr:MAG: hypothetical protein M1819_004699 [Sarea resinae]